MSRPNIYLFTFLSNNEEKHLRVRANSLGKAETIFKSCVHMLCPEVEEYTILSIRKIYW